MSASVIMMFASDEAATMFKNWMKAIGGSQFVAHSKVMDPRHAIDRFHYAVGQADKDDLFTAVAVIDRTMRNRTIVGIPDSAGVDSPQGFVAMVQRLLAGEKVAMAANDAEAVKKFNELFPGLVVPWAEVPPPDSVVNNTPAEPFKERYKDYRFTVQFGGLSSGMKPLVTVQGWDELIDYIAEIHSKNKYLHPLAQITALLENSDNWTEDLSKPRVHLLSTKQRSISDKEDGPTMSVTASKYSNL